MNYLKILFLLIFPISGISQVTGDWYGILDVGATQIPITIHVNADSNKITLDSPDQLAYGMNGDSISISDTTISFDITKHYIHYSGVLNVDKTSIEGEFDQGGFKSRLAFFREEPKKKAIKRPQTPPEEVEYNVIEVKFKNKKEGFTLHGTLTIPKGKGPFPAVVMDSGTGQQDRNEEMVKHKPFHVIAHFLTSNGVAVLRFDDRYFGESAKNFYNSTMEDFAGDLSYAVDFLAKNKKIDKSRLGVIGHSEGGIHAPIAASKNDKIKFIVALAGVGVTGIDLLIKQRNILLKLEGITQPSSLEKDSLMLLKIYDEINSTEGLTKEKTEKIVNDFYDNLTPVELAEYGDTREIVVKQLVRFFKLKAMQSFLLYDPKPYFKEFDIPLLALNGLNDVQVEAKQNLEGYKRLSHNSKSEMVEFDGLNHLFQKCESCTISEYGSIETTIEQEVLDKILDWINKL